ILTVFPPYAPGKLYFLFGGSPMDKLVDWFKHGEDDSSSMGMASSSGGFESGDVFGEFVWWCTNRCNTLW
ncbi:MAG: hypothetical protein ABIL14_04135, partial [candidate division WOR-3 bacterium]